MARSTSRTTRSTLVGLCLVLAACGRSDATAPASLSPTAPRSEGGEPGPVTVLAPAAPRAAATTVQPSEGTTTARAVAPSTAELLQVTVRCAHPVTGPLELYVLDADANADDGARHDAVPSQQGRSAAWPIVDDPATRLDIDGALFDGDTTYEIVRPDRRATIVARMGELSGRKSMRSAKKGVLVVSLDTSLPVERTVLVRDANGVAVSGARVGTSPRDTLVASKLSNLERLARVTTDGHGAAIVLQRAPDHVAFAILPLLGLVAADEHDPLLVILPDTATLVVSARPSMAEGRVTLRQPGRDSVHFVGELQGVTRTLRCEHLPLGTGLLVRLEGREGAVAQQWVTTPAQPGEELGVTLDVLRVATLTLQLVDEAHAPLPGIRVDVAPFAEGRAPATSDADGRVVIELDPSNDEPYLLENVHVVEAAHAEVRRRGRTSILADALIGSIDGGVVVLRGPRVVVAGRVVNTRGEPIEAATLELLGYRSLPSRVIGIGGNGPPPYDPPALPGTRVVTGSEGRFELRTSEEYGEGRDRLLLQARARGYATTRPRSFDEGEVDLVVTLGAPGSITVDTTSIPRVVAGQLSLRLYGPGRGLLAQSDLRPSLDYRKLNHGTYSVGLNLDRVQLDRIDGLVVPEGSRCADPRLAPLRFDGPIEARTYEVATPRGEEAMTATLYYWLGDKRVEIDGALELGRISVVVAAGITRTALALPGHVAIDVTDLPDGARIELAPQHEVQLALVGGRALPERLRIWVEREGYDLPATHLGTYRVLNEEGETTLRLPGPGRYVVRLDSEVMSLADPTFEVRAETRRVELLVR